ncbi:TPA: hypothetical protein DDZ75_03560 [Patescibacteria group bacterium]|nr:hypothetical protein [Patescibacteria group bacterium]
MKIPKWFWVVAIIILIVTTIFLKLLFETVTSSVGLGGLWTPTILILLLAILVYSLLTPIKFKTPTMGPINWGWLIKWSCIITLCGAIVLGIWYGYKNWDLVKSYCPNTIPHFSAQKKWVLTFERSHDERNWDADEDSFRLDVEMIKMDKESIEFITSRYNKNARKTIRAHFVGTRMKTGGRRYSGMYTQGKKGESHYINQPWEMDMIREDKLSGYMVSSDGVKYMSFLEKK